MARIRRKPGVRYPVLTPNMKGFAAAIAAKADEVAVFVAASETFSHKNTNCSIAEGLDRARPIFDAAKANNVRVRGYVSCALGCPYEGDIDPRRVAAVAHTLHEMGAYEVSLSDTIGTGTAGKTQALFKLSAERVPMVALAGHFHDTYGQALAVCEGRHGQRCQRRRRLPDAGIGDRDWRGHDETAPRRAVHLRLPATATGFARRARAERQSAPARMMPLPA